MYYVYDGSFEGFLSAVTEVFRSEAEESMGSNHYSSVCKEEDIMPLIPHVRSKKIEGIAEAFGRYLSDHFCKEMPETVYRAFLSDIPGIEEAIIGFIRLARRVRKDPIDMLNIECVRKVAEASKRTGRETHKYMGLLRFRKLKISGEGDINSSEIFFAEFEPVSNCLSLLGDHFSTRFADISFFIADRKRNTCLLHTSGHEWSVRKIDKESFEGICAETKYESLWQNYFKCLAVPERINADLQASNMPKRYWKHLVENPGNTGRK
jgi:probable DNA metabolism protein